MSYKTYCDLCGEEIFSDVGDRRRFKIKEQQSLFDGLFWKKIDAHNGCVRAIVEGYKAQMEVEGKGGRE